MANRSESPVFLCLKSSFQSGIFFNEAIWHTNFQINT